MQRMVGQNEVNFADLIDEITSMFDWSYIEMESHNRIRFDYFPDDSFWVNDDMTFEGNMPPKVRRHLKINGFKFQLIWHR